MTKKPYWLTIVCVIALVACTPHRVRQGTLRDTLFSVEETNNGYWRVWMTHDDIAGYRTGDVELGEKALSLLQEHDGEVVLWFRAINEGDTEYSWWGRSDCGSVDETAMFLFEGITAVPSR